MNAVQLWGETWSVATLSKRFHMSYYMLLKWQARGELTQERVDAWIEAKERRMAARRNQRPEGRA